MKQEKLNLSSMIVEVIRELKGINERIDPNEDFYRRFGFDSLDINDFWFGLEEKASNYFKRDITLTRDDLTGINTVTETNKYMVSYLNSHRIYKI